MFHIPLLRRGTISSDEGFRIVLRTRYHLEYQDNFGLCVSYNYDAVFPNLDLLILSENAVRNEHSVELTPSQKEQIRQSIVSALQWKGYIVRFVESR